MSKGLLDGVRVLDLTRVLAGPYCAMMLADMGADVIKIEMPGRGEIAKTAIGTVKVHYMNLNRNKRGMTLNLAEEGKEIFRIVKQSDITRNYRPELGKSWLGLRRFKEDKSSNYLWRVSGFGHYGPYSQRPGYDIIGQAMSGLMSRRLGRLITRPYARRCRQELAVPVLAAYINRSRQAKAKS